MRKIKLRIIINNVIYFLAPTIISLIFIISTKKLELALISSVCVICWFIVTDYTKFRYKKCLEDIKNSYLNISFTSIKENEIGYISKKIVILNRIKVITKVIMILICFEHLNINYLIFLLTFTYFLRLISVNLNKMELENSLKVYEFELLKETEKKLKELNIKFEGKSNIFTIYDTSSDIYEEISEVITNLYEEVPRLANLSYDCELTQDTIHKIINLKLNAKIQ